MSASEDALGGLHVLVAQVLAAKLGTDDCTAADINAAIKFLKDNNITATREANTHLQELENELGKQGIAPADDEELQRALEDLNNFEGGAHAGISS